MKRLALAALIIGAAIWPARALFDQSAPGIVQGQPLVKPTSCSGTITSGGAAQAAIASGTVIHGFTIANIDPSAGSGEPLWFSLTTTAAANTDFPLSPPSATSFANLASYTTPFGFGTSLGVSVFAATTGHKFSCTYW